MTEPNRTETPETKTSLKDKTLKAAGYSYLVGDALMIKAGMAREPGKKLNATVGGATTWLIGGLAAARYGNPGQQKQQQLLASDLLTHLESKGAVITDDLRSQSPLLAKRSLVRKGEDLLYKHPSEGLNAMYGIGATMLLKDGIKDVKAMGRSAVIPKSFNAKGILGVSSNLWMGITIVLGALAGIFIKEDPEAKKKAENGNVFSRAWATIKEKPLRLSATLYAINNVFLGLTAYQDFKGKAEPKFEGKAKPHWFSIPQLCIYLFANTMLLLSRRDQMQEGGLPDGMTAQIEDAAARVIAAQTPEKQRELLADVSEYMATQKGIKLKAPEIAAQLSQRIAVITEERPQPSVTQVKWAHREEARQHAPHTDMTPLAGR